MVSTAALFCQLLLAASTFTLPSPSDCLAARLERRARSGYQSHPGFTSDSVVKSNITHAEYNLNWAGAVLAAETTAYEVVTGNIIVPTSKVPLGGDISVSYTASAWVGIDGYTCRTAILQTGIDFTIQGDKVSHNAWYEWYPDVAYDLEDININAGDQIVLTVSAPSATSGTAFVKNLSTGQSVTKSLTSNSHLRRTSAEWIVEDFEQIDHILSPDFGTDIFSPAQALTTSGVVGLSEAKAVDIVRWPSKQVLTSTSTTSNSVTVKCIQGQPCFQKYDEMSPCGELLNG